MAEKHDFDVKKIRFRSKTTQNDILSSVRDLTQPRFDVFMGVGIF